jgi:hypothetical protein
MPIPVSFHVMFLIQHEGPIYIYIYIYITNLPTHTSGLKQRSWFATTQTDSQVVNMHIYTHTNTYIHTQMYQIGNDEFVLQYNKLVQNSFRVVNDADVFARLPRNKGIGSVPGERTHIFLCASMCCCVCVCVCVWFA